MVRRDHPRYRWPVRSALRPAGDGAGGVAVLHARPAAGSAVRPARGQTRRSRPTDARRPVASLVMLTAAASDPSSTAAWSLGIAVLSLGVSAFSLRLASLAVAVDRQPCDRRDQIRLRRRWQPLWDELITVEMRDTGRTAIRI